jgi:hypothetical protein
MLCFVGVCVCQPVTYLACAAPCRAVPAGVLAAVLCCAASPGPAPAQCVYSRYQIPSPAQHSPYIRRAVPHSSPQRSSTSARLGTDLRPPLLQFSTRYKSHKYQVELNLVFRTGLKFAGYNTYQFVLPKKKKMSISFPCRRPFFLPGPDDLAAGSRSGGQARVTAIMSSPRAGWPGPARVKSNGEL